MSKGNGKVTKIHFNKVCRSCLSERGRLREIFSTRLPMMMEKCASIQVSENDKLPKHICVSCFHQILKFYNFKRRMEKNDRILRNYLEQTKSKEKSSEYSDILNMAVSDAQIELTIEDTELADDTKDFIISDEDIPLSERQILVREESKSSRLTRKSKQKANKIIDTIIRDEVQVDSITEGDDDFTVDVSDVIKEECITVNTFSPPIFTDGPPPLIPLATTKSIPVKEDNDYALAKNLPENTPPLVPIKSISPAIIVKALGDNIEQPVELKLQCSHCTKEFSSVLALKQHRTFDCLSSVLQCNICNKEFKDRKRLIGHLKGHMVVKDYGCRICGKCYPNASTFRVHMRTHTGERPFKCPVCSKGFVRWAGVVGHMKTHNSLKPYKCETCGKGFKVSSNLERHKVLHSGSLPYCCSYCGKTFSQSDNLQLHIRTYHTNERPYLCNACGKGFVSSTRLNRHMWVHTGYKPYRCNSCPKAYSNSNDLKNHERTHTGVVNEADKPHVCPTCEMRFFHACRLAKHMKTHERPYACLECTKTFTTQEILNKHVVNKHRVQLVEQVDIQNAIPLEEVLISFQ